MSPRLPLIHIYIDHSNIWGGARGASKIKAPTIPDRLARVSVRTLDQVLGGRRTGVSKKIVSGGVPPGMEGMWLEYQNHGYDTQRLFRDEAWQERGVDHTLIGHMWQLLAKYKGTGAPIVLVLASGDGKTNEFGTSFKEIVHEVTTNSGYEGWTLELASFHWPGTAPRSPLNGKMHALVTRSSRGRFINLMDEYSRLVYHEEEPRPGIARRRS